MARCQAGQMEARQAATVETFPGTKSRPVLAFLGLSRVFERWNKTYMGDMESSENPVDQWQPGIYTKL